MADQDRSMGVTGALRTRRAVKKFDAAYEISDEAVRGLLAEAIQAPTAFNIQNWRIIRVRDSDLRARIRAVAWDQPQVTDASELLILCADNTAWAKEPERYWQDAPQAVQDMIVPNIRRYYQGRPMVAQDEGQRSCGMLGMAIMALAAERGLDTCPMDGFDYSAVAELIDLPADHAISFMIALGKRAEEPFAKPGQLPLDSVVYTDGF